eukprot:TRINITY_DN4593_c0_g1_i1.p1 TRINITY_DN4593_c0_g1~~TRINITY_DN4593_c0_g1_i1.p1  ORF type:complete len:331 (+),score=75.46 TRINITY_DN4593_c0_g1_i1:54-995(+)
MEQWAVNPHEEMGKRGWSMVKEAPDEGYTDISGCKGIWKKILSETTEKEHIKPKEGSMVEVEYWYRYDGKVFDSTEDDGAIEVIPGSGMCTAGMEEGLISMNVGERATFRLDPIFGFKENGFPPSVPEWSVIDLEMVCVSSMGPWTHAEKVDAGIEFKNAGNEFFKNGEYRPALKKYNKGLDILGRRLRKLRPELKDIEEQQHKVRVQILQNCMQCWFKLDNIDRCLELADQIIRQDEFNPKARFRKARHELSKHNYYTAREHLEVTKAHVTDPDLLKQIDSELRNITRVEADSKRKEKDTAKRISQAFTSAG